MTTQVSSHDWEALSAYLDGQLSPRERARLETRLKTDVDLQQALQELRRTRAVLRNLPKLRAPRNYMLSPEMAGVRKEQPRVYPVFRFASLLASLLFVLLVAGDYLVAQRYATTAIPLSQTAEAPLALMEEGSQGTPSGPLGGGLPEAAQEEPAAADTTASGITEEAEEAPVEALGIEPRPTGTAGADSRESPQVAAPEIGEAAPPDTTKMMEPPPTEVLPAGEEQIRVPVGLILRSWGAFRIAEIILALVAIVTGLVAISLRRGFQR